MADSWAITTKGFDKLEVRLAKLGAASEALRPAMLESLKVLRDEASRFPPQPSRTRAPSGRYNTWMREVGALPLSAFVTLQGKPRKRIATRTVLRPSEKLLQRWRDAAAQIRCDAHGITGTLTNTASYAPFVQGEKQARFHAQTPWLTVPQIYARHAARITHVFNAALKRLVND